MFKGAVIVNCALLLTQCSAPPEIVKSSPTVKVVCTILRTASIIVANAMLGLPG